MIAPNEAGTRSLGYNGFKIINAGDKETLGFSSFLVISDVTLKAKTRKDAGSRLTSDDLTDNGDYSTGGAITFYAGTVVVGPFEEIDVTSGSIIAYRG